MVLGIIAASALTAASARERVLMDSGWRFPVGRSGRRHHQRYRISEIYYLAKWKLPDIDAETRCSNPPRSGGNARREKMFRS